MAIDSIPARFLRNAETFPDRVAYRAMKHGAWRATSWGDYVAEARRAARGLVALGLPAGGKVSILGWNRPEWLVFGHAAMLAGGAAAGIYTTSSIEEIEHIVNHSESLVLLVETAAQAAQVRARRDRFPGLRAIVVMRGGATGGGEVASVGDELLAWEEFLRRGDAASDEEIDRRVAALREDDLATLIYTSGTTGPAKAVMLSHGNLSFTTRSMKELVHCSPDDVLLSYLPLSHIAEQTASMHLPAASGMSVYFAESMERIPDNLKDAQPTIFFGVPRIWEKMHAALSSRFATATGGKKHLLAWARRVCTEVSRRRCHGQPLPLALEAQYRIVSRLVLSKLKPAIGLGRARLCVSGAAPIATDVLEFFASLDLVIHEIYGQSEDSGPTSFNFPGATRFGSVGRPVPGVEVKLGPDDEVLVRGKNVFLGYYKDPAATDETLVDGWLHSGDLGRLDPQGFLHITGRKKELIITAGGKNISPRNIEAALKESPLVGEAVVIGDRRKFLSALLTLEERAAATWMAERQLDGDAHTCRELHAELDRIVDGVNRGLARVEHVRKFTVLPQPLSVERGELTPTLKIRRKVVAERYAREIEAMYAGAPSDP